MKVKYLSGDKQGQEAFLSYHEAQAALEAGAIEVLPDDPESDPNVVRTDKGVSGAMKGEQVTTLGNQTTETDASQQLRSGGATMMDTTAKEGEGSKADPAKMDEVRRSSVQTAEQRAARESGATTGAASTSGSKTSGKGGSKK
jgi:hypothetical protein